MIDLGLSITRDDIRGLAHLVPNHQDNQDLADAIARLLKNKNIKPEFFVYSAPFAALSHTATAATPFTVNIANDGDFMILAQTFDANVSNAGQTESSFTYPLVNVTLSNATTGKQYMDRAVPVPSLFGTAQQPFFLPQPIQIPAASQLLVQAQNYDAAQDYNLNLHFIGVKLTKAN